MAVRGQITPVNNARPIDKTLRLSGPGLRQPTFDWKVMGKYKEMCSLKTDIKNIFYVQQLQYTRK